MAGQAIGYFEAWLAWADGMDIRSRVLWGLEIYWWARISKITTLIAAMVIALDIIGEERLKRYLDSRRERSGILVQALWIMLIIFSTMLMGVFADMSILSGFNKILFGVAILGVFAYLIVLKTDGRPSLLRTFLWFYNHKNLLRLLRTGSLLLIILAFHFDFLAS